MNLQSKFLVLFASLFFASRFLSLAADTAETAVRDEYFQYGASLQEAVDRFNKRFGAILEKHSTGKLTVDEVINSLAIGTAFFLRPEHSEVANLCVDILKKKEMPNGSALLIYLWEEATVGKEMQKRQFVFIYLSINARPHAGPKETRVPSEEESRLLAALPVRLSPYK